MSEYQVIARKWRPQCFSEVVGQEHVVRTLRNAIRQQRTAHAYLFVGPRGVGKTTLARIFAKALNCRQPVDGEPCGECDSCRSATAENNLDIIEIDAASHNTAADMRELSEEVLHLPAGGRYKIYIIDEVHMLSKTAWNALLKTVEEPPAHVKFIFATTEVHQVLPTIISRCQRFDLLPIPTRLIADRLRLIAEQEQVKIEPAALEAVARAAEGGMRDAQSLLDQMIAFFAMEDGRAITAEQVLSLFGLTDRGDLDALLAALLGNDAGTVVEVIHRLSVKGKNLETLFDDLLAALRGVRICLALRDPESVLDEGAETIAHYREVAAATRVEIVQILLENLAPVGRLLHDALNKQIFLETIFLKAMREAHAVRIDDLLARLNQLRQAGELQFLDQVPVPEAPRSIPVRVVAVTPAPAAAEVPETPAPAAAEVPETPAPAAAEVPETPAPAAAEVPETPAPAAAEVPETPAPAVPEAAAEAAELEAEREPEAAADMTTGGTAPLPESESGTEESAPGHHKRRSMIHDDPGIRQRVLENPRVRQVAELFDAEIVDVHQ